MLKSMLKDGEFKELEFKVLGLVKSPTQNWTKLKIEKLTIFQSLGGKERCSKADHDRQG